MEPRNFSIMEKDLSSQPAPAKKLYKKPEMTYLAPLEAMAVICIVPGKSGTGCNPIES